MEELCGIPHICCIGAVGEVVPCVVGGTGIGMVLVGEWCKVEGDEATHKVTPGVLEHFKFHDLDEE